jgi:hypothetical protein
MDGRVLEAEILICEEFLQRQPNRIGQIARLIAECFEYE